MINEITRNFKLVSNNGATVELLGSIGATPFLHSPDGLGFEYDVTTSRIYNNKLVTGIDNTFRNITGELIFSSYDEFNKFKYFVQSSQKRDNILFNTKKTLKLYYTTQQNEVPVETYFDVFVTKIDLSEKELNGLLICPVIFERLSNLKEDIEKTYQNAIDITYPDTYPLPTPTSNYITYGNNNTTRLSFDLDNTSNIDIPVYFEIAGEYHNPIFENTTTGNSGGYNIDNSDGILKVDPYYPQSMTQDGTDITAHQDNSKDNFLIVKPGINKVLFDVSPNQPISNPVTITVRYVREVE